MKISTKPLDKLFSEYIRKERPACEYCDKRRSTQVHHYHRRRIKSVRSDEKNVFALCFYCHRYLHEHPAIEVEWVKKKLGEREFNALDIRQKIGRKPDIKLLALYYKQKV